MTTQKCPQCQVECMVKTAGQNAKPQNRGRQFISCKNGHFTWIDAKPRKPVVRTEWRESDALDPNPADVDLVKNAKTPMNRRSSLNVAAVASAMDESKSADTTVVPPKYTVAWEPSEYQLAIKDAVLNTVVPLQIVARAGSGKTTTNAWWAGYLAADSLRVKNLVFAKANQLDMAAKMPAWIPSLTSHSSGYADVRRAFGRAPVVRNNKMWMLLREHYGKDESIMFNARAILRSISLFKNVLEQNPSVMEIETLSDYYDIDFGTKDEPADMDTMQAVISNLLVLSNESAKRMIDFDDMLNLPALGYGGLDYNNRPIRIPVEQSDLLIVDEYQDNNMAQREYYLKTHARIVYVGDPAQSIYGFRGATLGAMQDLANRIHPETLPLPISYRSALSIITLAQTLVPDIQARPHAPDGTVSDIAKDEFTKRVTPGDMVLCRNNAPLVRPCLRLLQAGIPARIKGRDIGEDLWGLFTQVEKLNPAITDFPRLLVAVQEYADKESEALLLRGRDARAASLLDRCETLLTIAEGCATEADLKDRIEQLFSDDVVGVCFSTVHKAKGLEADNVFILEPQLLQPQKYDKKPWQLEQLHNIRYVAITRAKLNLAWVSPQ